MARKPFFSGNYGSALARVDTRPIIEAGRAQGQMYANMGKQIGGMIEQYGLNKEKQKKNEGFIKSQSGMLDMLAEQDPEMASQYSAMKEQLNNPDVPLATRAEFGKNLVNNITLSSQLKGQRLLQDTQAQTLKEKKNTELLREDLLKQKQKYNNLGIELQKLAVTKGKELNAAEIQDTLGKYGFAKKKRDADAKLIQPQTDASIAEAKSSELQSKVEMADIENQGGVEGVAKNIEEDRELRRANQQSLIDYRDTASLSNMFRLSNINTPVPQDLEKRFSEIATLISKNDDSTVKVRTSGLLGGEEKEISYKEYKDNPGDYAPLVNDRIKALKANEERLRKEQTNVIQGFKIPVIDKETGEQIFITLFEKMEYDKKRKNLTNQENLKRSLDQRSGYMGGMDMDYSNLDPSVAELMAGSGATQP